MAYISWSIVYLAIEACGSLAVSDLYQLPILTLIDQWRDLLFRSLPGSVDHEKELPWFLCDIKAAARCTPFHQQAVLHYLYSSGRILYFLILTCRLRTDIHRLSADFVRFPSNMRKTLQISCRSILCFLAGQSPSSGDSSERICVGKCPASMTLQLFNTNETGDGPLSQSSSLNLGILKSCKSNILFAPIPNDDKPLIIMDVSLTFYFY